jgi:hypothetical protein
MNNAKGLAKVMMTSTARDLTTECPRDEVYIYMYSVVHLTSLY